MLADLELLGDFVVKHQGRPPPAILREGRGGALAYGDVAMVVDPNRDPSRVLPLDRYVVSSTRPSCLRPMCSWSDYPCSACRDVCLTNGDLLRGA